MRLALVLDSHMAEQTTDTGTHIANSAEHSSLLVRKRSVQLCQQGFAKHMMMIDQHSYHNSKANANPYV